MMGRVEGVERSRESKGGAARRTPEVLGVMLDLRAALWAAAAVVVVLVGVFLGSGGLRWFNAALAGYLIGVLMCVFATVYRYLVWLQRPLTARLNQRGWELFRSKGRVGRNAVGLVGLVGTNLLAQGFIRRRSTVRWAAHQLVFWGCILAAAVTFPLTFGWIHFESVGQDGGHYRAFLFGVGTGSFQAESVVGFLTFHLFFWLREDYGLVQFGLAAGASTLGSMCGNITAPILRRSIREEMMLTIALTVIAGAGISAAVTGGLGTAIVLAFVVNFSCAIGRLAFDSIVQRDAPDANQGRAFARFETRFQLAWVLAGLAPVFFTLPGPVGFLVVGLIGAFAAASYLLGSRAVRAGKPLPATLGQRARRGLQDSVAKRRGDTNSKGLRRPGAASAPTQAARRPHR